MCSDTVYETVHNNSISKLNDYVTVSASFFFFKGVKNKKKNYKNYFQYKKSFAITIQKLH